MTSVPPFDPADAFGRPGQIYDHELGEWRMNDGSKGDAPGAPGTPSPAAFRDILANYFRARPNTWIDASVLQGLGGRYAWRTRVSECRTQLGMAIGNRQRRERRRTVATVKVSVVTVSEYCFVPSGDAFRLTSQDAEISSESGPESK